MPGRRAWEEWTPALTRRTTDVPGAGLVETWTEVTDVSLPLVTFRRTWVFASDGAVLTSDSTLRFRERDEVVASLAAHGFTTSDVRGAPRPARPRAGVHRSDRLSRPGRLCQGDRVTLAVLLLGVLLLVSLAALGVLSVRWRRATTASPSWRRSSPRCGTRIRG